MKRLSLLLLLTFVFACNNQTSRDEVDKKLREVMTDYLYKSHHSDTSEVKYVIKDLYFYDDDKLNRYDCEFRVTMKIKGRPDTTGAMKAYITKDFKKVDRFY